MRNKGLQQETACEFWDGKETVWRVETQGNGEMRAFSVLTSVLWGPVCHLSKQEPIWCLNMRKTMKFYILPHAQIFVPVYFPCRKMGLEIPEVSPYHVPMLHRWSPLQVSGRKQSCQWELSVCCFYNRIPPCGSIRDFSKARSAQLGQGEASHPYSFTR